MIDTLRREALANGELTTIHHRSAKWWKVFSALESEYAQGGAVVVWLGNELKTYLAEVAS